MFRKPVFWMFAGVVLAALVVTGLAIHDASVHKTPKQRRAADAKELIAEYKKSRLVSFRADQKFERFRQGQVVISTDITFDQDPPRQASLSGDNEELILQDSVINCSIVTTNKSCASAPAKAWDTRIQDETDALYNYFFSVAPIYTVTKEKDGCFRLDNIYPAYPSPPYGTKARFCFDKLNRPTKKEVFRETARDLVTYVNFSAPNEADFTVPKEAQSQ